MTVCAKAGKDRRDTSSANPWPSHTFSSQPTSRPLSALSGILGRALACVHAALVASSLRSAHPRISPNQRAPLSLDALRLLGLLSPFRTLTQDPRPWARTYRRPTPSGLANHGLLGVHGLLPNRYAGSKRPTTAPRLRARCARGAHTRDTQNGH